MGDPAVGVGPDLRAGRLVVAGRVLRVRVLVGLPGARGLPDQPVGHRVVGVRVLGCDRRRADHHLGAVGPQHVALVLADLVRADEDAVVAALLGDQRQPDAGVPAGRFDDGAAGLQLPGLLGRVIIFSAIRSLTDPPGLTYSTFASTSGATSRGQRPELDQRGVADQVDDGLGVAHGLFSSVREYRPDSCGCLSSHGGTCCRILPGYRSAHAPPVRDLVRRRPGAVEARWSPGITDRRRGLLLFISRAPRPAANDGRGRGSLWDTPGGPGG